MINNITPTAIVQEAPAQENDIAETISSLQNIIESNAILLRKVKADKKIIAEQMKDLKANDTALSQAEDEAVEHLQAIKEAKHAVNKSPESVELRAKKAELTQEEKEIQETLSNHLVSYYGLTNSNVFDTSMGEMIQMKVKATISTKQLSLF